MRTSARLLAMLAILTLLAGAAAMGKGARHGKSPTVQCPPNGDVAAALAAECPCDGSPRRDGSAAPWRNHREYVSCVVHLRKALRKAGCFRDDSFRRAVARCAAGSTRSKEGTVPGCLRAGHPHR